MPEGAVVQGDIKGIINHIDSYIHEDVDAVIGGPPCQGFSSVNQQRVIDDPRNKLYKYYIEAVKAIAPKIVIMENVRGMLTVADQVVEDYSNIEALKNGVMYHYIASYRLLDSQYFNVAQSRVRLIYVAIRNDIAEQFQITPNDIYDKIEDSCKFNKTYNLSEALKYIKPLESPRIKNRTEIDDEKTGRKIDVNEYISMDNDYLRRINENRIIPFVFNHKARYASDINYEIFKKLKQGEDGTSKNIIGLMPYERRKNIFKDKYYKLIADKPCRTITAHLRMDCLSHIHPYQVRTLTPREAARVQSFPDDYLFLGTYLKTYMQIGNAVPVLMAKQIAEIIKNYL
jgi:DNA (cytosine-5)-methyltransferase 1